MLGAGFLLALTGCATGPGSHKVDAPDWYAQRNLPEPAGRPIAYGKGSDPDAARQAALAHLSQRLEVLVQSDTRTLNTKHGETVSRDLVEDVQIRSEHRLRNVRTLRTEQPHPQGPTYTAVQVDLRPAAQVLAGKLVERWPQRPTALRWEGPEPLINSPLLEQLAQRVTSDGSGPPKTLAVSLAHRQGRWVLNAGDIVQPIRSKHLDQLLAWDQKGGSGFGLQVVRAQDGETTRRLRAGDRFILATHSPRRPHYLTLFNIYADGRVALLLDGQEARPDQEYPSRKRQERGYTLEAQTLDADQRDREFYLAVWSRQSLDTTPFKRAGQTAVQGDDSYRLSRLLRWLEQDGVVAYRAIAVGIRP